MSIRLEEVSVETIILMDTVRFYSSVEGIIETNEIYNGSLSYYCNDKENWKDWGTNLPAEKSLRNYLNHYENKGKEVKFYIGISDD